MTIKKQIAEITGRALVDDYDELPVADLKALADSHTKLLEAAKRFYETNLCDPDVNEAHWNASTELNAAISEAEKI
jgi:hypothetical protein